jgi:hypothetical protein
MGIMLVQREERGLIAAIKIQGGRMFGNRITQAQFFELKDQLTRIERTLQIMATDQAALDAGIAAVQTVLDQVATDVPAAIKSLEDKINSLGNSGVDFTPEITSLTNISNTLKALDTQALATNPPSIIITPSSITFNRVGSTANITAAESANPSATFTAQSSDTSIATVSPGTVPGSFVVTGVAVGFATITFTDNAKPANTASVKVTSSNSQVISVSPTSVSLGRVGATANVTAMETANPSASFTATSANVSVATVIPGAAPGSFVITEVAPGTTTVTISDNATPPNTANVSVTAA